MVRVGGVAPERRGRAGGLWALIAPGAPQSLPCSHRRGSEGHPAPLGPGAGGGLVLTPRQQGSKPGSRGGDFLPPPSS